MSDEFDSQFLRVIKAMEFEKVGKVAQACRIYEQLIEQEFDGNRPYDRLVVIYKKKKSIADMKRVLTKAIKVFQGLEASSNRMDVPLKLKKFKNALEQLEKQNKG